MRNPNGYGSIYKQKGNRRKPWVARKTKEWKLTEDRVIQKYITIGYYETRELAMIALADYNKNPYNLESSKITFKELYEKYKDIKFNKISQSNINGYNLAYKYAKKLHDKTFVDIKTIHLQKVIDECKLSHGSKRKIKVLFNQLYKFAMQNDIIQKDYSAYIELRKDNSKSSRVPFTQEEINRLFELESKIDFIDTILVMIYTGMRIGELLLIENKNIDIENRTMTGGIKTEAGKNRIIPLNKKIIPLIEKRLDMNNTYLIVNANGDKMKYDNYYRERFIPIMEQLGMKHKPHDCRHTFATLMSNSDANEVSIRKIIGHSSYETTKKIYTHKDIEELKKAIDLI
jgi:integrase